MRHWGELTKLESGLIDLGCMASLIRVVSYGMPESNRSDVDNAMSLISDQLDDLSKKLYSDFDTVFKSIREEDNNEAKRGKTKKG